MPGALKDRFCNGLHHVVVSLGGDGALYCGREGTLRARVPKLQARSLVGCGDALMAGMVSSIRQGKEVGEALRWGVAAGTAKVMCAGTAMPPLAEIQKVYRRVKVERISS